MSEDEIPTSIGDKHINNVELEASVNNHGSLSERYNPTIPAAGFESTIQHSQ
jgi:hypothetical protein